MLLTPDCIHCIYKASLSAVRQVTSDETTIRKLVPKLLDSPALRGTEWNVTSAEVIESAMAKISEFFDDPDPFGNLKEAQNRRGQELLPWLRSLVRDSGDCLETAINLAVIGNSVDVMWAVGIEKIETLIEEKLKRPVPPALLLPLVEKTKSARHVVYFADNCGEVLFDRVLIETMKERGDIEVFFVVRSVPTLNDVTRREAEAVGMYEVARIVENGIDGPLPGTILSRCSEEVRELVHGADLIVSKGGGNFDTLDEERYLPEDTFFMLMCKCFPYTNLFGTELYTPILRRKDFRSQA